MPTLALPVALNVVEYTPIAPKLPTLLLPAPLRLPTSSVAITLEPVILPVAVIIPAPIFPMFALPDTDTLVNVPTLVIFDCDAFTTSPAYAA